MLNKDNEILGELYSQIHAGKIISEASMMDRVKGMFSRKSEEQSDKAPAPAPRKDFLHFLNQWVSEANYPGSNPPGQRIDIVTDRDPSDTSIGSQIQYKVRGKVIVQTGGMNGAVMVADAKGQLVRVEGLTNQLQAAFKAFAAANSPGDINLEKRLLQQAAGS